MLWDLLAFVRHIFDWFFFDTLYIGIRIQIYFLPKKFQKASVEYKKKLFSWSNEEFRNNIALTSQWPRWRLKSPASRLFTQRFIQTQIKENIKAPRHWPLCGEFTGTGEFPAQRASYAKNVSIWWRHHDITDMCYDTFLFWIKIADFCHISA